METRLKKRAVALAVIVLGLSLGPGPLAPNQAQAKYPDPEFGIQCYPDADGCGKTCGGYCGGSISC